MRSVFSVHGLTGGIVMLVAVSASAATLHVSPSAGGNGDGSAAAPFGGIGAAVSAAEPGDTIIVSQGTYRVDGMITVAKDHLKIIGIADERPTLVAKEDVSAVFSIIASNVVLQDLNIQGGFYGVKLDVDNDRPTRGITIRNCSIGSTAADCIKSFDADDLKIENCQIGPSGEKQKDNAEGIDIIGSLGVAIRNCYIHDVATNGIYFKGGTSNGTVERCFIAKAGNGGILLGQDTDAEYMRNGTPFEAINCVARNNIIVDTLSAGLATYSAKDISFLNNTAINVAQDMQAGVWIVVNSRGTPAENVTIRNNIVVVGKDRPVLFVQDTALPNADFNVYFARKGEPKFVREIRSDDSMNKQWTFTQWQQAGGKDTHSRIGDPQLDQKLFRPLAGSPAIGAGDKQIRANDDYFGHKRDVGITDAGAVTASAKLEASDDEPSGQQQPASSKEQPASSKEPSATGQ